MAFNTIAVRPRPYLVNNYKGFSKEKEDNESSQSSRALENQDNQYEYIQNTPDNRKNLKQQQQLEESREFQKAAIASRDANLKNASVNIAQILKDFRSTVKAIGSSPELAEEVEMYLSLVEKQVTKPHNSPIHSSKSKT